MYLTRFMCWFCVVARVLKILLWEICYSAWHSAGWRVGRKWAGKGGFQPAFSWEKKKKLPVWLLIAPASRCGSLRLTNGSFHTTQAEKARALPPFSSAASLALLMTCTRHPWQFLQTHMRTQPARGRNIVDNISQWIVSKREWGLALGYGHLTHKKTEKKKSSLRRLYYFVIFGVLLLGHSSARGCLMLKDWKSPMVTSPMTKMSWP